MARYNEILVGRYNRLLQKLFGFKGGPPAAQLSSEVMPVFPFFNGAENRYLESWDLFAGTAFIAAQAAATVGYQLRNPVGSNVIAVLEKITIETVPTGNVTVSLGSGADLPVAQVAVARGDVRGRPNASLVATSSITSPGNLGNNVGNFSTGGSLSNPYDVIGFEEQELIVSPGFNVRIVTNINNTTLSATIYWRERFLEDSERA
jgi:hypothetical protein